MINKNLLLILMLTVASVVMASEQQPDDTDSLEYFHKKIQQCLSLIDPQAIKYFEIKGVEISKTIKGLCENGKRNKAQSYAVRFAVEIQKSKDLSIFRQCGKIIDQSFSETSRIIEKYFVSDLRYVHICDQEI